MRFIVFGLFILISIAYVIFGRKRILHSKNDYEDLVNDTKISVIIPARNEEQNLKKLLPLILNQTIKPFELIVVDDNSTDGTYSVASSFENVKVIRLTEEPPKGWVGKSWAIWNGFSNSSGNYLLFLDADVEPEPVLISSLIQRYRERSGLITVWPYQRFERFYEHLTLPFNLLVIYASNNLGFPSKEPSGAFGPVIFTSRKDYEMVGGHEAIRDGVLEDIKLGKLYLRSGLKVTNFLGNNTVKFRMYPNGIRQLFEGFSKNMSSGAITAGIFPFALSIIWMSGVYSSISTAFSIEGAVRYMVTALAIYVMAKPTGDYKWYDAILYPVHFLFFLIVFFYSLYLTIFKKQVSWKGRKINV